MHELSGLLRSALSQGHPVYILSHVEALPGLASSFYTCGSRLRVATAGQCRVNLQSLNRLFRKTVPGITALSILDHRYSGTFDFPRRMPDLPVRSRFRLPEMPKLSRYCCSAANPEDRAEPSWHPLHMTQSIRASG